jgi:TPP-dependent pyruvate/acetoin dehydrogenase alpha subunit
VGGGLPAVVGGALAFKMRGERRVAVAFFGDGATNTGVFHESLNLAQLWKVPALFVCENNRWSESTPQWQHQPITDLTKRALAFGMHALRADGQDVEAVHLAALDALAYARSGNGPVLLVCETERLTGHYIGDPQVYRDKAELRKLRETRDPIANLRARLALDDERWTRLDDEARHVVDDALEFALAATDPEPSDALKYVYAERSE